MSTTFLPNGSKAHSLTIDDAAAEQFVHYKSEQLEAAMESGEA